MSSLFSTALGKNNENSEGFKTTVLPFRVQRVRYENKTAENSEFISFSCWKENRKEEKEKIYIYKVLSSTHHVRLYMSIS